jgi:hypothetical protein
VGIGFGKKLRLPPINCSQNFHCGLGFRIRVIHECFIRMRGSIPAAERLARLGRAIIMSAS